MIEKIKPTSASTSASTSAYYSLNLPITLKRRTKKEDNKEFESFKKLMTREEFRRETRVQPRVESKNTADWNTETRLKKQPWSALNPTQIITLNLTPILISKTEEGTGLTSNTSTNLLTSPNHFKKLESLVKYQQTDPKKKLSIRG